jgi:endonuclease/exonuclease/phosphatase family metal-dependent hydrolase
MLGLAILFPNRHFSKVAANNLAPFGGPPVVVDQHLLHRLEAQLAHETSSLKTAPNSEKKGISYTIKLLKEEIRNLETVPDVTQKMKDRGVLLAVLQDIRRPHAIFAVATTHVPCDYSNESLMQEYAIRIKRKMDQWMQENINSKFEHKVPLLFCGDMNSGVDSPFYREFLRDSDFQDAFGTERNERMCTLYSFSQNRVKAGHSTPHSLILDHMFIPHSGLEVVHAIHPIIPPSHIPYPNEEWPSDHLAVEIVFRIAESALFPAAEPGLVLYKPR